MQHEELRDTKVTQLLTAITKYTRWWFDETFVKEVFLMQLPSDVCRLLRMLPPFTPVTELSRMVGIWVIKIETTPSISRIRKMNGAEDVIDTLHSDLMHLKCQKASQEQHHTVFQEPSLHAAATKNRWLTTSSVGFTPLADVMLVDWKSTKGHLLWYSRSQHYPMLTGYIGPAVFHARHRIRHSRYCNHAR